MVRRPPSTTLTYTLFPATTLCLSDHGVTPPAKRPPSLRGAKRRSNLQPSALCKAANGRLLRFARDDGNRTILIPWPPPSRPSPCRPSAAAYHVRHALHGCGRRRITRTSDSDRMRPSTKTRQIVRGPKHQ